VESKKYGTFRGVFIPSFEAIFGAVIFLLLPNLTSTFGFLPTAAIIVLAHMVSLSTTFSINDCASSVGRVASGGIYALSKTSLGSTFGGSLGIQLYLGKAISIGFYSMGFSISIVNVLRNFDWFTNFMDSQGLTLLAQQQFVAGLVIFLAFIFALIGSDFTSKIQLGIFFVMLLSISATFASLFINPTFNNDPIFNSSSYFFNESSPISFWSGLTIFFPAVTGFIAGVGMSGLLKNPRKSIRDGTFLAITITFLIYLGLAFVYSFIKPQLLSFDSKASVSLNLLDVFGSSPILYISLLAGVFVTTSSSSFAFFITAPLTLQAIVKDKILPNMFTFLGEDFTKKGKEPRFAIILTFIISILVILSGDLAFIARLVGIAYLMIFGWINFAAFLERLSMNPSFRPTAWGHWAINLLGFLLSIVLISLDNILLGVAVFSFQMLLYYLLSRRPIANQLEGVWWGFIFRIMSWSLSKLKKIAKGKKNWRPVVGVFTIQDDLNTKEATIQIGRMIGENLGIVNIFVLSSEKSNTNSPNDGQYFLINSSQKFSNVCLNIAQTGLINGMEYNTILLPFDPRFDTTSMLEQLIEKNKNILLFKNSEISTTNLYPRIDIWWRGFENGNLMAILAHMMISGYPHSPYKNIRIIRTIDHEQEMLQAKKDLEELLDLARIDGEILIIYQDKETYREKLKHISGKSGLILMGMPGSQSSPLSKFFKIDKLFFNHEIRKYGDLPPILFVKSAGQFSLLDD